MSDIRLKKLPVTFEGREFVLTCNFNVLADVQEACGGKILDALESVNTLKTTRLFLWAMINDAAAEMGLGPYTERQVGRAFNLIKLSPQIMDLVRSALIDPEADPN